MATDPYTYFRIEGAELLDALSEGLLRLERGEAPSVLVPKMLREAHTLKGAARIVKCHVIADSAHTVEELLQPFRSSERLPESEKTVSDLSDVLKVIEAELAKVSESPPAQVRSAVEGRPVSEKRTTLDSDVLRVDAHELDALSVSLSEAAASHYSQRVLLEKLQLLGSSAEWLNRELSVHEEGGSFTVIKRRAEELARNARSLERELSRASDSVGRELSSAASRARGLRMVRAKSLFTAIERAISDAARELNKQVDVSFSGGDIRVDGYLLDALKGALLHVVKNSVAHGVESVAERTRTGKPESGIISLTVEQRQHFVVWTCQDDGRGVDLKKLRERYPSLERDGASEDSALRWLTQNGVSMADSVNSIAGRGIGLDAVRATVEGLGGRLSFENTPGQGFRVHLVVPTTLQMVEALEVESAHIAAAVPLGRVLTSVRLNAEQHQRGELTHDNALIPMVSLERVMGRPEVSSGRRTALVLNSANGKVALVVSRLGALRRDVLRRMPEVALVSPALMGVIADSSGAPRVMLNDDGVHDVASRQQRQASGARRKPWVLVIDDSPTTRMLEQGILEANGYLAALACSGEEGLQMAREQHFDLFLVDVEMPGMNGFDFIACTREDPELGRTPAVLVTSLSSPEHVSRGKEVGAAGYILKHQFDEREFLALVADLTR